MSQVALKDWEIPTELCLSQIISQLRCNRYAHPGERQEGGTIAIQNSKEIKIGEWRDGSISESYLIS